jgi:hypothetical protein
VTAIYLIFSIGHLTAFGGRSMQETFKQAQSYIFGSLSVCLLYMWPGEESNHSSDGSPRFAMCPPLQAAV